jgi:hypothetical protein
MKQAASTAMLPAKNPGLNTNRTERVSQPVSSFMGIPGVIMQKVELFRTTAENLKSYIYNSI